MRYGMCTDFITPLRDRVDYPLVKRIAEAGFDYAEFSVTLLQTLANAEFDVLVNTMREYGLDADACCNFFPGHVKVVGPQACDEQIRAYLDVAIPRASRLGIKKIVFGSAAARMLPPGMSVEAGYDELSERIKRVILPYIEAYDLVVAMEPIRWNACNFINTLAQGMEIVNRVADPRVRLLADSLHILTNREDAAQITEYASSLEHIHIAQAERALPEEAYSDEVGAVISQLKKIGYDKTISLETKDGDLGKALSLLKRQFS